MTRVDGKIASVSRDYLASSEILANLKKLSISPDKVVVEKIDTTSLFQLSDTVKWEDFLLFGTPFRKKVWKGMFEITHGEDGILPPRLVSYTELAELLGMPASLRNVASAVGDNPSPILIPCHLVIPLPSNRKMEDIGPENSLFRWKTLSMMDSSVDYGNYGWGADLKRELIRMHMAR